MSNRKHVQTDVLLTYCPLAIIGVVPTKKEKTNEYCQISWPCLDSSSSYVLGSSCINAKTLQGGLRNEFQKTSANASCP